MPTYEYECTKCAHRFERFQSMTEEPVKRCPRCRSKVRRLLSGGAGVIFKGDGFHATDYRSSEYKKRAKEDSKSASQSDSSSTPSSDSGTTKKKDEA